MKSIFSEAAHCESQFVATIKTLFHYDVLLRMIRNLLRVFNFNGVDNILSSIFLNISLS